MENNNDNNSKWDINLIVAVIAIAIGAVVTIATPELRRLFCLEKEKPAAPAPSVAAPQQKPEPARPRIATPSSTPVPKMRQQHVEKATSSSGPFSATLHENQTQRIEAAKTSLSILFNEELNIVTLTIAPDGKQTPNRAVLNGYAEEFTSSAGVFLVHILNVDWNNRTVTVQVSKKSQ